MSLPWLKSCKKVKGWSLAITNIYTTQHCREFYVTNLRAASSSQQQCCSSFYRPRRDGRLSEPRASGRSRGLNPDRLVVRPEHHHQSLTATDRCVASFPKRAGFLGLANVQRTDTAKDREEVAWSEPVCLGDRDRRTDSPWSAEHRSRRELHGREATSGADLIGRRAPSTSGPFRFRKKIVKWQHLEPWIDSNSSVLLNV